jgi:hypothetical protein
MTEIHYSMEQQTAFHYPKAGQYLLSTIVLMAVFGYIFAPEKTYVFSCCPHLLEPLREEYDRHRLSTRKSWQLEHAGTTSSGTYLVVGHIVLVLHHAGCG